jgi:large subunit ribosomal protein L17
MRHRVYGKKLGRHTAGRGRLKLSLATAMIEHERIETTHAKAVFIRDEVEKLITTAKRGLAHPDPLRAVHARRIAGAKLNNSRVLVGKLFDELAPRYAERPGGYTRLIKIGPRKGDGAEMVILEFVDRPASE